MFCDDNSVGIVNRKMILSEFAKFLHSHETQLSLRKISALSLLPLWIHSVITKNPKTNSEKIIHKELMYCQNPQGDYVIIAKSESGRTLLSALIKFANSYSNYMDAKWLEMAEKSYHSKN